MSYKEQDQQREFEEKKWQETYLLKVPMNII